MNRDFDARRRILIDRARASRTEVLRAGTLLVIPSISFPSPELQKITGIQHYEERLLFVLLWLSNPDLRIVYVTSHRIDPVVIDYYLRWLDDPESARSRVEFVALDDHEPRALSAKLLEQADMVLALRELVPDRDEAVLLPFNVTTWERTLSDVLDIPLYGPAPELIYLGSKSGSRRVAREAGVPVLEGSEDLYSLEEMEEAIDTLRDSRPAAEAVVIKLNHGFSGQGNAIVETADLMSPLTASRTVFCGEGESWPSFERKILLQGGIVEELVRHAHSISPSVQLRVSPTGLVEVVSTHDQILGGPDAQVYLGCRFPADRAYRSDISRFAQRIGEVLGEAGVIGSFGMDFIGLPVDGGFSIYLGEINLRMGGTTHPYQMARAVTGGVYDPGSGELLVGGSPRFYVASDNLKSDRYRGLSPGDVIDLIDHRGLAFDPARGVGVTLHLLGAVTEFGKLGALCVAESALEADRMYDEVVAALESG